LNRLRLPYRLMLIEQGFTIIYAHVSRLSLENTGTHALPAQTECSVCKGTGEVEQHGGLRKKTCPRCAGRGWIKAPLGR
jgi:DnaJ-class molecular chaperone